MTSCRTGHEIVFHGDGQTVQAMNQYMAIPHTHNKNLPLTHCVSGKRFFGLRKNTSRGLVRDTGSDSFIETVVKRMSVCMQECGHVHAYTGQDEPVNVPLQLLIRILEVNCIEMSVYIENMYMHMLTCTVTHHKEECYE